MKHLAAIQYCAGPDWITNRDRLESLLGRARGAEVILLPENFACYGGDYRQLAETADDIIDWLGAQARDLKAWLIAGSLPQTRRADGSNVPAPRVRSAQLAFTPEGQQCARYDKLHLFDVEVGDAQGRYCESSVFEPGDKLVLTQIAGIRCGLAICYDLRFSSQALWLAQRGAELLLYPSAFTQVTGEAHWQILLRARAVETGCYVLAANQCGQHNVRRASYGHSMLVDPWGRVVSSLGVEEGVLPVQIDLSQVVQVRKNLPLLTQQRLMVGLPDDIRFEEQF
jgi:predicted amidohydrolase